MLEEVDKDYVIICKQRVNRPDRFSRSKWLDYWEDVYKAQVLKQTDLYYPPAYFKRHASA